MYFKVNLARTYVCQLFFTVKCIPSLSKLIFLLVYIVLNNCMKMVSGFVSQVVSSFLLYFNCSSCQIVQMIK